MRILNSSVELFLTKYIISGIILGIIFCPRDKNDSFGKLSIAELFGMFISLRGLPSLTEVQ